MGRAPEVTDEEIIAAGRKLDAVGEVNATRLWKACNEHGRPDRLLEVWKEYKRGQSDQPLANAGAPALPIPEAAQRLAAGLKGELSTGIDRALASIYREVEDAVQGRFRQELADLTAVRESHRGEIEEALAAIGDMSVARDGREIRIKDLEGALASVLRERDVSEALRAAEAEQHDNLSARLHETEACLQHERQTFVDLKIAQVRGEVEREGLDRQCGSIRAKLEIARVEVGQHKLDLMLLRESEGRNIETIRQRGLEIEQIREHAARTEAASLAWMERAIAAKQASRDLRTPAAAAVPIPEAAAHRPRERMARRAHTDVHAPKTPVLKHSSPNEMAAQPTVGDAGDGHAISLIGKGIP